jgi:predicted enzyme related to lactoylglutathione lyase
MNTSAVTAEQLGVQGLGWFVRRSPQPPTDLVPFYAAAWGLSAPRPPGPTGSVMLWAGDLSMFEITTLTPGAGTQSRAGEMSLTMLTSDFPKALRRMRQAGASLVAEQKGPPQSAMLADPDGHLLGLLATEQKPRLPATTLGDLPALPMEIGGITKVALRVADPAALAAFYQNAFGLPSLGTASAAGAQLSLGRGITLDLRPGGHRHDAPADRKEVPDVWILRVRDHDALAARLQSLNVQVINHVKITGGVLTYAVDPEGHLFGIQQRTPDLLPSGRSERVEDTAANAAWANRSA